MQCPFLPSDTMRKRGLCCRPVSVCLSVRLSVTSVYCIHTAEDIVKLFSRAGSPIILVFLIPAPIPNSKGTPSAGTQNTRGWKKLQFSTEITAYFGNDTR